MNDIQIIGLVMATVCIICGTIIACISIITKRNNQLRAEQAERNRRQDAWNRTFESEAMALYEAERQKANALATKCGIYEHQLRRAREQMAKMKVADNG